MKEWISKHKGALMIGTYIASCVTMVGTYVVSVIRGDKRQIKLQNKAMEFYDEELRQLRGDR